MFQTKFHLNSIMVLKSVAVVESMANLLILLMSHLILFYPKKQSLDRAPMGDGSYSVVGNPELRRDHMIS